MERGSAAASSGSRSPCAAALLAMGTQVQLSSHLRMNAAACDATLQRHGDELTESPQEDGVASTACMPDRSRDARPRARAPAPAAPRARCHMRMRMHFQNLNLNLWARYVCCGRIQSAGCVWWARDATDAHAPSSAAAPASSASRSPCAAALLGTQLSSHLRMNAALPRCSVVHGDELTHGAWMHERRLTSHACRGPLRLE